MGKYVLSSVAAVFFLTVADAAVTMPHVFGNNMVLQQGQKVPVWGKAEPGEKVTVAFAGQTVSATADDTGRWKLFLAPLTASSEGRRLEASTSTFNLHLDNVVVGEVWFCSGQSNMEFPMGGLPWDATRRIKDSEKEIAAAKYPLLRHFKSPRKVSNVPLDDVDAKWEPTTPETVANKSAVAYVFGETLLKELKVPVGLIECSWGGTRIEPWTPAGHLDDLYLLQSIKSWRRRQDVPTVLWNGMVAGICPYAIKGAIWYQGCANRADGETYIDKTVSLVRGWRREWGQGDFPYFLVQLAPFKYDNARGSVLPVFQEAQARIPEKVPNSGYTVINDVGNVNDIHPTDKRTVGMRMADQALDRVYGKLVRPWKTPTLRKCTLEGEFVRVSFDNATGLKTRDGKSPTEFELLGPSNCWVTAEVRIEGADVILSAPGVVKPLAMRFAPYNGSTPNLVNGDGLPAGPCRMHLRNSRTDFLYISHVHRGGGKKERPDNTLETFKWCWENGSALECDCRKTKDGVGIMLHDDRLQRTARGISEELAMKSVSKELTWDEIKDVDVGSYLGPQFAHHRIPTIEAVFAAMKGHPTCLCFVDEKGAGPEYIAKKAIEAGVQDQVYYTGPSHEKIFDWQKTLPGGKAMIWLGAWPRNHGAAERARADKWFREKMSALRAKDFKYIDVVSIHTYYDPSDPVDPFVPSTPLLKEMVSEFHAHGIKVASIPFRGGETEEVYFKLHDLGFDGFSTDYPSVMFKVIRNLKSRTNGTIGDSPSREGLCRLEGAYGLHDSVGREGYADQHSDDERAHQGGGARHRKVGSGPLRHIRSCEAAKKCLGPKVQKEK